MTLVYTDSGKSTTLATAKIEINGKEYTLSGGSVVIPKSDFDIVHELKVTFTVNTIDGYVEVTLVNPHAKFLNDMKELFTDYSDMIKNIYE